METGTFTREPSIRARLLRGSTLLCALPPDRREQERADSLRSADTEFAHEG